ncbi:MAG: DMT family transporter [Coriobacteriia bacterium]|nr:DMT family transporter [Coriobacteriia bacterium]
MKNLPRNQRLKALAALVITVIFWGSAFVAIRAVVASGAYTPGQLSAGRMILASLLLGILVIARGGVKVPQGRDWIRFFILGLIGQALYHLLLNVGERTVDAGTASLLVSTSPILASLLAVAFLGERLTKLGWVGTGIAFVGAATIAISSGASFSGGLGVLLIVAATCLWATYLVLQKTLSDRYNSLALTAWPMWIGALLLTPFAVNLPHAVRVAPLSATLAVLWLATFASVVAFLTWAYALQRLEVTVATTALYCVPVAAFAISIIFLAEIPPATGILGGVIAIAGVALVQAKGRPEASKEPRSTRS